MAGSESKVNENEYPFWVNRYAEFSMGMGYAKRLAWSGDFR
jgi:hypothetical protein